MQNVGRVSFVFIVGLLISIGSSSYAFEKCRRLNLPWSYCASDVFKAWKISGANKMGKGARILDIDTGVRLNVPELDGKIEKGKLFGSPTRAVPFPYYDENGHGTAVAALLVGNINGKGSGGIAPLAQLLVAADGAADGDIAHDILNVVDAFNWGIQEHVDVINLEEYPTDGESGFTEELKLTFLNAIKSAYQAGISVVIPSGNRGDRPLDAIPKSPYALAVGAIGSDLKRAAFSQYGPELGLAAPEVGVVFPYVSGEARGAQVEVTIGERKKNLTAQGYVRSPFTNNAVVGQIQFVGTGQPEDFRNFVSGRIALIQRVGRIYPEKIAAETYGASAILFIDSADDLTTPYRSLLEPLAKIPVAYVERSQGLLMQKLLSQGHIVQGKLNVFPTNYAAFGGTSGAAPVVSGTIALMKAVNKNLTVDQIYTILKETATRVPSANNEYGSGIVNSYRAVKRAITAKKPW